MAAGTTPIYTATPDVQWIGAVATANTTTDLTSGTIYLIYTAAANGAYLQKVTCRALGTNTASVIRIWVNNAATTATAANNTCVAEATLAATTVSQVAALTSVDITLNIALQATYRVYATLGTTVAAGYNVTMVGGAY